MKIGDYIRVCDEAYRVPPQASRASMEVMGLDQSKVDDPKTLKKIDQFKRSAKGLVQRSAYGVVKAIKDDLVVFKNLSNDEMEHAAPENCTVVPHSGLPKRIAKR